MTDKREEWIQGDIPKEMYEKYNRFMVVLKHGEQCIIATRPEGIITTCYVVNDFDVKGFTGDVEIVAWTPIPKYVKSEERPLVVETNNEWISIIDENPGNGQEVITVRDANGTYVKDRAICYYISGKVVFKSQEIDWSYSPSQILAWIPVPEFREELLRN